jgi:hypothetical protein
MDAEMSPYGPTPELALPDPPKLIIGMTKDDDVSAFTGTAWRVGRFPRYPFERSLKCSNSQLSAGHIPSPKIYPLGAVYSLAIHDPLPRPVHPELSDKIWDATEGCWGSDPPLGSSIKTDVAILEGEIP